MNYYEIYNSWLESESIDEKTKEEINAIIDEKDLEDRFYKELEFGTGGLRGVIGVGSNRMNIYTVGKSTQGLADYLLEKYKGEKNISVSIAYDSRIMSKEFAERATSILCANGIKVYLFESLRPTPELSYTVRTLKSKAGIVVTASHNPKEYNGYKVYGDDGGQVTDNAAKEITSYINRVDNFSKVRFITLEKALSEGLLEIIGEEIDKLYIEKVKALSMRKEIIEAEAKNLKIIYTPLHGSGNMPIRRVLKELGYSNLWVVSEQEHPDGTFPTAKYPNPEVPQVFSLAMKMAEEIEPDIIFGTDPDCDRIGTIVRDKNGEYKILNGNMMGILLTNYILSTLKELNLLESNGVVIKTIVTTEMAVEIAKEFNIEIMDVLTGFKYIGEKIKEFSENEERKFIFGFEESYGYLAGDFVRDKDAVIAAMLICEMAAYYKKNGLDLYEVLLNLYEKYGFYKEDLVSIDLEGKIGQEKISKTLEALRHSMKVEINGIKISKKLDYMAGIEKDLINLTEKRIILPESNVIKFILEDKSSFVARPSGTEPKMKIYMSVVGKSKEDAEDKMGIFKNSVMDIIQNSCDFCE